MLPVLRGTPFLVDFIVCFVVAVVFIWHMPKVMFHECSAMFHSVFELFVLPFLLEWDAI
jgi:hypothetical protein